MGDWHIMFAFQTSSSVAVIASSSGTVPLWRTAMLKASRFSGAAVFYFLIDLNISRLGWLRGVQTSALLVGLLFFVGFMLAISDQKYELYRYVQMLTCLANPLVAHCYMLHIYNLPLTCEIGD